MRWALGAEWHALSSSGENLGGEIVPCYTVAATSSVGGLMRKSRMMNTGWGMS